MRFSTSGTFASVNRFFETVKQQVLGHPNEPAVDEVQANLTRKLAELRAQHMREGFQAMRGRRAAAASTITDDAHGGPGENIVMSSGDDHLRSSAAS